MSYEMPSSALQNLAVKWRVIGLVIVAFARLMRRYEDGYKHGAYEQVQQLYVIVRAAQIMLTQDMAEAQEDCPPDIEANETALTYLRAISVALLALAFVLENIIERGLIAAPLWSRAVAPAIATASMPAMPIAGSGLLDPG